MSGKRKFTFKISKSRLSLVEDQQKKSIFRIKKSALSSSNKYFSIITFKEWQRFIMNQ